MHSVPDVMAVALQNHQAGKLQQAEQLYRQVLQTEPQHIDALHLLGLIDYQLGRNELAIDYMKAALRLRPNFAEAHNNLGAALLARGLNEEAEASFRLATRFKPDYAEAHNNLGNALRLLGRLSEALASLRQALQLRPNYASALTNMGLVLRKAGQPDEAAACLRQALILRPDSAEILGHLGEALAGMDLHADAIDHYQRALAIQPDLAKTHTNLGNALAALDRHAEAMACYRHALAIDPELPEAHDGMGNLLRTLGFLAESRQALEKAVALAPTRTEFLYNLSESKRFTPNDPHLSAMEVLAEQTLPASQRIFLHFALGKAYADLDRHEDSFRHLLEGNRLKRQQITYDEAETLGMFQRAARILNAELMQAKAGLGDPSPAPIFIVGMPRSGSTLIEQVLASHPKVYGAGEIKAFHDAVGHEAADLRYPQIYPDGVPAMTGDHLRRIGAHYAGRLTALAAAARITDKMLGNFVFVGLIHLALPNARILHARRDSIDTCLSCFSKCFASDQRCTYDLAELGRYFRAYESLMEHWRRVLPEGVMLEVQYEELVADFAPQARRIVAHCGLAWDERCLAFHETRRPIKNASAAQVRQPLYRNSIGRWRPYQHQLQPLLDALGRQGSFE